MKANRSLGSLKPAIAEKNQMGKGKYRIDLGNKNTKLDFDLRLPGKKGQCIRKVKGVFSQIIDSVGANN